MTYICPKCVIEPESHSFQKINETQNGVSIFYCCPSKAKYYNDNEGILEHYDGMLKDNGDKPWIWIFDSKGFSMKHAINLSLAKNLAILINVKYSKNLKKIIIINTTWHINITLKCVMPFLDDSVSKLIIKYS
jgi:hypothetical protein